MRIQRGYGRIVQSLALVASLAVTAMPAVALPSQEDLPMTDVEQVLSLIHI